MFYLPKDIQKILLQTFTLLSVTWILEFDVNKFKGNTNTKNLYNYT